MSTAPVSASQSPVSVTTPVFSTVDFIGAADLHPIESTEPILPIASASPDMKTIRVSEWKGQCEREIQTLLEQATTLRKIINESKTATKKQFYTKKFKKVSASMLEMLSVLQKINSLSEPVVNDAAVVVEPVVA
jgi:hypothetical protein